MTAAIIKHRAALLYVPSYEVGPMPCRRAMWYEWCDPVLIRGKAQQPVCHSLGYMSHHSSTSLGHLITTWHMLP